MTKSLKLKRQLAKIKPHAAANGTNQNLMGLGLASVLLLHSGPAANATPLSLGTAGDFAVLAGSTVTSIDATVINGGYVGTSPGTAITGFPPGTIAAPYTTIEGGPLAAQGQSDLGTAYNDAAALPVTQVLTGQDLGGLTLTPGVYFFSSSAQLTGTLTLNDQGNPNAQFVFQIGSTLTTAASSSVVTINGGPISGRDVFWQVGSAATLGASTAFEGNILAKTAITAGAGATDLDGRLLAETAAVSLDDNAITVPPAPSSVPDAGGTLTLLGSALATLLAFRRKTSA
jgi:type VI secretion system secreted protein VgrG